MKLFGNVCYAMGIIIAIGLVMSQTTKVEQGVGSSNPCTGYYDWEECSDDPNCEESMDYVFQNPNIRNFAYALADGKFIVGPNDMCTSPPCGGATEELLYDHCCIPE